MEVPQSEESMFISISIYFCLKPKLFVLQLGSNASCQFCLLCGTHVNNSAGVKKGTREQQLNSSQPGLVIQLNISGIKTSTVFRGELQRSFSQVFQVGKALSCTFIIYTLIYVRANHSWVGLFLTPLQRRALCRSF